MVDNREKILEVKDLNVTFHARGQEIRAVRGVSLEVCPGEILGIVGESGSGKSVTMKAVLGILPENASIKAESLKLSGTEMTKLSEEEYRKLRGTQMTMIFQDPMTALDPVMTVGKHMEEVLKRNGGLKSKEEIRKKSIEMLDKVGIPDPQSRLKQYPHEFSGGMRQRVLIAMALACNPKMLIADEPTTALDVTIQAQILDLLQELEEQYHTSIVLITHDMGVVATVCQRVAIMYGGLIMETGTSDEIFYDPKHPYTKALLRAIPSTELKEGERLQAIEGLPPSLVNPPAGCPFAERCEYASERCAQQLPEYYEFSGTHRAMCHLYDQAQTNGKEAAK
ncbi:MAG: ABC transporter ATP-binding protein [Lachnospiraceae bacterium]|uniref:ABC transporter ATP-binding protein n=1 Tax=Candidatus Enterocloster excrementigallinarum TaxID=2838558 RepID=A0A9D2PVD8_9FIRM|nr:ABC transporter ATP-binding protein [Lachnospiraceae bacterium]HJC68028.1 ABC transporter ATP-binding protein [Candidatus Enterocloster excrementigallinarum]